MKHFLKKTYYVPKPYEQCDKGLIKWGNNNLYGQWVNWLYYNSSVHAGIINGKVFYTTSGGLITTNPEVEPIIKKFNHILPDMSRSLELANCYYLKCRLSIDKTRIEKIDHIPFEWVRATEVDGVYRVSEDWAERQPEYHEMKTIEHVRKSTDRTDLWFIYPFKRQGLQFQIDGRRKKLTENYYPVVPYSGAINSILTDIEISNYHLSEIVNNFSLGTILSLNSGKPHDEKDAKDIINRISDETTGSDNAGGVMVLFSNGKETEPSVLNLNGNQLNERYMSLSKDVRDNIMKGHSVVSGELFGFMNDGNFNAATIDWAYWIMKNNYFKQRQKELLESVNFVMDFNGVAGDVEFEEIEIPTGDPGAVVSPSQFKKEPTKKDLEQQILAAFEQIGIPKDEKRIVMSEPLDLENQFGGVFDGKESFADFSAVELQVMSLILDGESFESISKALGIKPADLAKLFQRLRRGGHVNENGQLTESGRLETVRSQVAKMQIMYSYELRPDAPALVPGGKSRDFCATLIRLNRLYTREEIDRMSNDLKTNVFVFKGGWYTVPAGEPGAGTHQPACRHYWQQNIVYR